ncbi:hypothetical protein CBS101457_005055 [Exobasidium rhododendri]|nr:hypothetical protein CBS101457_005055 [Exobasidium rhododendri]
MFNRQHSTSQHDDDDDDKGASVMKSATTKDEQTVDVSEYTGTDSNANGDYAGANVDEAYRVAGQVAITFTAAESNAVRRKIDKRIPVLCAAIYFSQYLDKTLLNYASITGLPIEGQQYNQVSAAFYYGYLVFVFPSSALAQRFPWGPTKYLGISLILWGVVLACTAVNPAFGPFFALRFLLGMLESCVTPILIGTVVAFYRIDEQAKRIACFYAMNGITEIVGPLIAYAVTFYNGAAFGNGPWRLLYVVFGLATFVLGVFVVVFMPSSPLDARFLSKEEKRIALERVRGNASGTVQKKFKLGQVKEAVLDIRIWIALFFIALTSIPNGGLSNFSSKILKNVGYSSRQTLLIGLPKGVFATLSTLLCAYLSDRYRERMLPVLVALLPTIVGAGILVGYGADPTHHKGALVFAIYLSDTFGSSLAIVYAWNASNVGGSSKKTAAYAATMFAFSLGNIAGTYIFQAKDAPNYIPGKIIVLVTLTVAGLVACLLRFLVLRAIAKKQAGIVQLKVQHGWSEADVARERDAIAFRDLTDKENPYFAYTK